MLIIDCLVFFFAGMIQDFLLVSYQRFVNAGYKWRAAFISAFIATIGVLVISRITVGIQPEHVSWPLIAYALGKISGTYSSLSFYQRKKDD